MPELDPMAMRPVFRPCLLPALPALVALAGCGGRTHMPAPSHAVTGHVTYRERVALPADAEVRIQILDVSRMDAAATPVADTTLRPQGRQVPLPFALPFDPERIDPRHDYAIRATITSEGRLAFSTTAVVKVITRDHPTQVDLVLVRVPSAASPTEPGPGPGPSPTPPSLQGTSWVLQDLGGARVIDKVRATLEFPQAGRAAGRGSCNQFTGSVTITGSMIAFGPLASTRMACADAVMKQETGYLQALQRADGYAVAGSTLLIYVKEMDKPLRFTREKP